MDVKELHEICETVSRAIAAANEKIRNAGGKLSAGDAEYIDSLTHILKSVKGVIKMEEEAEMDDGYSERGYSRNMYSNRYDGGSYGPGRGRGSNARRDSMGRYSNRGYSRDGYPRDDGYSGHGEMVDELRDLMNQAPDEQTRQEMQRLVQKLEQR